MHRDETNPNNEGEAGAFPEVMGIYRKESIHENLGQICWLASKLHSEAHSEYGGIIRERIQDFHHFLSMFECKGEDAFEEYWTLEVTLEDGNFAPRCKLRFKLIDDSWRVVQVDGEYPEGVESPQQELVPYLNRVLTCFMASGSQYDDEIRRRLLFRHFVHQEVYI